MNGAEKRSPIHLQIRKQASQTSKVEFETSHKRSNANLSGFNSISQ